MKTPVMSFDRAVVVEIRLGEYRLSSDGSNTFWLCNAADEGVEISNIELELMLGEYFKENF